MKLSNLFKKLSLFVVALFLMVTSMSVQPSILSFAEEVDEKKQNILDFDNVGVHDPSIIKVGDDYYVFGTHGAAAKSKDMMNWKYFVNDDITNHTLLGNIKENLKDVFTWAGNSEETIMDRMGLWAPDVIYNENYKNDDGSKGAYLMYFSLSTGKENGEEHYRSIIGLAASKNIEGPYAYRDPVVYSGFKNIEGSSHYDQTDFNDVFKDAMPRSGYFHSNGSFNFDLFPNAIDPSIIEGKDGSLYMSYGSWNGGIWVLELDQETGLPIRQDNYNGGKSDNADDTYFGTRISGGYRTSGEGSYIEYHEDSEYYHLYVTYGGLTQQENYNVRFFRSKDITGPYLDRNGNNPKFNQRTGNDKYGDKLIGSFEFKQDQAVDINAQSYDYRVPGHNSILYGDYGKDFIAFHTRFKDTGEAHELRVHQLLFDEEGWPLIVPQRYHGETVEKNDIDLEGTMLVVKQDQDNSNHSKQSQAISLHKDGSVSGFYNGTWSFKEGKVSLTLDGDVFEGYALKQATPLTNWYEDTTITLIGKNDAVRGISLLGIRVSELNGQALLDQAKENLEISKTSLVMDNLNLPLIISGGIEVTWTTSDDSIITKDGVITRGETEQNVILVATLRLDDKTAEKSFELKVPALENSNYIEYRFDSNLEETKGILKDAHTTTERPHIPGGNAQYKQGIVLNENGERGQAFYFDGETGIRLPDDLITGNEYSISLWVKPEELSINTPAFFGMKHLDKWISILPMGHDENIMLWSGIDWSDTFTGIASKSDTWYHYAITVDHGKATFYLNGEKIVENADFPDVFTGEEIGEFALGANFWDEAFVGLIDDLRVYPKDAISGSEVKFYYDSSMESLSAEEIVALIFKEIKIDEVVTADITLPTEGLFDSTIIWESSNDKFVTDKGAVTRPSAGEEDVEVTLRASIDYEGEVFTQEYKVTVKAIPETINYLYYDFNKTLEENTDATLKASLLGEKINEAGGNERYKEGIKGYAFYFDGKTGLKLPDDMIKSQKYTVSFWLQPEDLNQFSTTFFGASAMDKWLSMIPVGHLNDLKVWSGEDWYDLDSGVEAVKGNWSHVAFTNNHGQASFYIDGEKITEGEHFPNVFEVAEISKFALGVNYWDAPFKGLIDELIVYPTNVLGEKQIAKYYADIVSEMTPQEKAEVIFAKITLPNETTENIELVSQVDETSVTWSTSNPQFITDSGKITRPQTGQKDVSVRLSATIIVDGKEFKKDYVVVVKALPSKENQIHYGFENNLEATDKKGYVGKVFGSIIDKKGGNISYKPGILGNAAYLNGDTSIRLPDNLITSHTYTVSMWLNPDKLTDFTSAFFGASATDKWLSIVPKSGHENHKSSGLIWAGEEWYDGLFNQPLKTNTWQHIAFTVEKGKLKIYIDGKIVHEGSNFPDIFEGSKNSIFSIGANYWDIPFEGMIDELQIVPNEAISSVDIKLNYENILNQLTPEKLLEQYFGSLTLGTDNVLTQDIKLPNKTNQGQSIKWYSSNTKYLTSSGKVIRPSAKQGDKNVTLTATVMLDGKPFVYRYDLIVKAESIKVASVHYSFDKTLEEASKISGLKGQTTGEFIGTQGGKPRYKPGKIGDGLYLDGKSGVRLPDNLITSNKYSVSMWLKPETLTDFSTTFFGLKNDDSWISFTPQGVGSQAVLWSGTQWYDGLTNFVMTPNMWTHVAFTVDNGKVNVYIDGSLRHSGVDFPKIFNENEDAIFALGVNYWDTPFEGIIDELMVHNTKVLSGSEIYKYYDETAGDDRFIRNKNKHLKLEFEENIGPAVVTGDRLDNYGGSVSYDEGVIGDAVYLNGSTGLKLPDGFLTSETYSMKVWVKPEFITPFSSIFFGGTSNSSWVNLPASGIDGKTMFWSGENWYDALTPETIPANRWSHLAVSVDKGSIRVYIDGEEKFSGNDFPDIFSSPNSFAAIGVNFWDDAYRGLIDEFELFNNSALSGSQIKSYYEDTKPDQEEFERNQEKTHIFKFEDNLVDDMNDELEGTVTGPLITEEGGNLEYIEGKDGKALYLDGETGVLLPKELITSENYSVSLWVNPEEITPHSTTFFGSQNESSWVSVVPESGEFTNGNSMVWSGTDWYDGNLGTQIPQDSWSHIAFTVEEGTLSAYLNGEKVFSEPDFPDIFNAEDSVFALGVNYWDESFVGAIDEVMVFDSRVLTDTEVEQISEGEFDLTATTTEEEPEYKEESSSNTYVYIGGGVVGIGVLAYIIKLILDKKKS